MALDEREFGVFTHALDVTFVPVILTVRMFFMILGYSLASSLFSM